MSFFVVGSGVSPCSLYISSKVATLRDVQTFSELMTSVRNIFLPTFPKKAPDNQTTLQNNAIVATKKVTVGIN